MLIEQQFDQLRRFGVSVGNKANEDRLDRHDRANNVLVEIRRQIRSGARCVVSSESRSHTRDGHADVVVVEPTSAALAESSRESSSTNSLNNKAEARPRARLGAEQGTAGCYRESVMGLTDDGLADELNRVAASLASGTHELLVLVGEIDVRGTWILQGSLSCASWLADLCEIEISTARSQLRVARAMRRYAPLERALASGEISYAKARVLAASLSDDNADELVSIARYTPAAQLGIAIARWSRRNEDASVISERQHDARSCSWRTQPDGTVIITACLTPVDAGLVCASIDTEVMRTPLANRPNDNSLNHSESKRPTLAQQRADALVAHFTLTGRDGETKQPRRGVEVVVHVRGDGNTLDDGTPIGDNEVAGLIDGSFISLLIHDMKRQPIDASPRRRFPTRRQRRVIDESYPECANANCHTRTFLQYDHIAAFSAGGPTTVANLQRLCGPHNREKGGGTPSPQADSFRTRKSVNAVLMG